MKFREMTLPLLSLLLLLLVQGESFFSVNNVLVVVCVGNPSSCNALSLKIAPHLEIARALRTNGRTNERTDERTNERTNERSGYVHQLAALDMSIS